jgi:hypothetical protein
VAWAVILALLFAIASVGVYHFVVVRPLERRLTTTEAALSDLTSTVNYNADVANTNSRIRSGGY